MSTEMDIDTPVGGETIQPVTDTDAADTTKAEAEVAPKGPTVEQKEGKLFVDGVRVFTRDDTNQIAAKAKREVEQNILTELNVDNLKQVKDVVNQLQTANIEEVNTLDVGALKSTIAKREQTVEELRSELNRVKTDFVLTNHIGKLQNEMPNSWTPEAKENVITLMKAKDMFAIEGDTFAIRNGDDFITTDGETPDYKSAVEMVGKSLGLPFGKKGNEVFDADKGDSVKQSASAIDEGRMKTDSMYRNAYVTLRDNNKHLPRNQITNEMIKGQMKKIEELRGK